MGATTLSPWRATLTAARISGSCRGRRASETALKVEFFVFIASTAILMLPGKTPTSTAALARPASRRVRGCSSPTAQSSSATPLA